MPRTKRITRANVASGRPSAGVNTTRKPTNLLRFFVAIILLNVTYGDRYFSKDLIMEQVEADAEVNGEELGVRTPTYIRLALQTAVYNGYLEFNDETEEIRVRRKTSNMLQEIRRDISRKWFPTAIAKHRAYCDHIRQRVGRLHNATKTELYQRAQELHRENRQLRKRRVECKRLCSGEHESSIGSDDSRSEISIHKNPVSISSDASETLAGFPVDEEMGGPVAGPSSAVHICEGVSPVRKLQDPTAAYPSPQSLPRRRGTPLVSASPPSPSPSRSLVPDEDDSMDVDDDTAPRSFQEQLSQTPRDDSENIQLRARIAELEDEARKSGAELEEQKRSFNQQALEYDEKISALESKYTNEAKEAAAAFRSARLRDQYLICAYATSLRCCQKDLENTLEEMQVLRDLGVKDKKTIAALNVTLKNKADAIKGFIEANALRRKHEDILREIARREEVKREEQLGAA